MKFSMAPTRFFASGKVACAALLALTFCATHPASNAFAKKKPAKYGVIKVQTTPDGYPIEVDGRPEGKTTTTDWRSWNLDPGLHTIVIVLPDGRRWTREISLEAGRIKCVTLNYKPGQLPPPPSPCPYPVNLSAPSSVVEGEVITYTADVSFSGPSALNYTWTVSPASARILSGSGTPTITVDSTGFGGQRITATLVVDDGSGEPACRQVAQASTFIPAPPPRENPAREFDVCCNCTYDDQKARLDNLAVELQNDPSATTYIFAYGGRASRAGEADRLGARARDYLVTQRGIDRSRIVVLNGGFREEDCVELWIVPRGATPPQPRPTVQAGDLRPAREEPAVRRRRIN
jgi:hypothetical protein